MTKTWFDYDGVQLCSHREQKILYTQRFGDHLIGYISIPRNSSKFHRGIYGSEQNKSQWSKTNTWYAVIRNPRHRLISGLQECDRRVLKSNKTPDRLMIDLLRDPARFDEHVEPQAFFLSQSPKPPLLFNFHKQREQMCAYFKHEPSFVQRVLPVDPPLKDIRQWSIELIDRCIEKYYATDVKLWETVCN